MNQIKILDCTLRDGGYYNSWDFDKDTIEKYLHAMKEISIDYVELGLRGLDNKGFKGACAYTTDNFIRELEVPDQLKLGVMINASQYVNHPEGVEKVLSKLFDDANNSPISLVRVACHAHEFELALPGVQWLKNKGYTVGLNLMQIADRSTEELEDLANKANDFAIDVLYFADSTGSLTPQMTSNIVRILRKVWKGPLGIHAHDNMNFALINSMEAISEGVTWIDSTVTGMGRGPGNTKTEYLAIELKEHRDAAINILPLMNIIKEFFEPLQRQCRWGTNTFYYLAGKYGIHPTYIQEMLKDSRYNDEDILSVIERLKLDGGKVFNANTLETAKRFYSGDPVGSWEPIKHIFGKEVLILGSGASISKHKAALEEYIQNKKPYVIALNTQTSISPELIDVRAACHPIRLFADSSKHAILPQPLVMPLSMLPHDIVDAFKGQELLDFGISIEENKFMFKSDHGVVPNCLVISYALAIASSGRAARILLAGFDGYGAGDLRTNEINKILSDFESTPGTPPLISITPTEYIVSVNSIYAL